MKKILLSLAALASVTLAGAQELAGYSAATSMYIPDNCANIVNKGIKPDDLAGMSILSDASAATNKKLTGKGWPIGFDFSFNGKTMKYFGILANGGIKLSETEEVTMQSANFIANTSSANGGDNTIFFFDKNACSFETGDTTTISYTSTADELTVCFRNMGYKSGSWGDPKGVYTFMICLEKDGTIKYKFFGLDNLDGTNYGNVFMGIRGSYPENAAAADVLSWNAGPTSSQKTWQNCSWFNLKPVATGTIVTLNTPQEVEAPTAQPTDLQQETTYYDSYVSTGMTFTAAEGVDKYLALCSEGAPTELPVDGKEYAKGDSLGNAYIMLAGTQPRGQFYTPHLDNDKNYTITIYAYNSFGKGGAKYNTVEPLTGSVATAPAKPAAFSVKSTTNNSITLSVTANAAGHNVLVAYNDSTENPGNYGNIPYVGTPKEDSKAGDILYQTVKDSQGNDSLVVAGKVAYVGAAGEFTVEGLKPSTSYYFVAYSYNPTTKMFSDQGADKRNSQASASTNIVAPFTLDCAKAPESSSMAGWISTPGGQYNGFQVTDAGGENVTPQTEGIRHYEAQSGQSSEETYSLVSPLVEGADSVKLDWHIHIKGSGWFGKPSIYEEWADDDTLAFCAIVDGEKVVLKKYTADDSPTSTDTKTSDWHSEKFDLTPYAGKNVQFGIYWLATCSNIAYFSFENLAFYKNGTATDAKAIYAAEAAKSNGAVYNVAGQRFNYAQKGLNIQDGKKFVK